MDDFAVDAETLLRGNPAEVPCFAGTPEVVLLKRLLRVVTLRETRELAPPVEFGVTRKVGAIRFVLADRLITGVDALVTGLDLTGVEALGALEVRVLLVRVVCGLARDSREAAAF